MVRLPSMDALGARGVDVGMWIDEIPPPAVGEPSPSACPLALPAMRELGRGIADTSCGPTTRDKSLALLILVSSAFILLIMSAIIRLLPAAPLAAAA